MVRIYLFQLIAWPDLYNSLYVLIAVLIRLSTYTKCNNNKVSHNRNNSGSVAFFECYWSGRLSVTILFLKKSTLSFITWCILKLLFFCAVLLVTCRGGRGVCVKLNRDHQGKSFVYKVSHWPVDWKQSILNDI